MKFSPKPHADVLRRVFDFLTGEEEAELEAYVNINDLLAYWQSKARQTLQRPA